MARWERPEATSDEGTRLGVLLLLAAMIAALVWGIAAGCLARALLSRDKPGVLVTLVAGFAGSGLGFLVGHDLLGRHDMHLFAPGALLPSAIAALVLLLARSKVRRISRSKTIFG